MFAFEMHLPETYQAVALERREYIGPQILCKSGKLTFLAKYHLQIHNPMAT